MPDFRDQFRHHYEAQSLPAEKAEAILSRGRAAASGEEDPKAVPFPTTRRRWLVPLALAAGVLIVAGWFAWPRAARPPSFAQLAPTVVEFFRTTPNLPKVSQDKSALRAWHLAQGAPAEFAIPARLLPLESLGCDVLRVEGKAAYLTCFWREKRSDGGDLVHLLVVKRGDFRDTPPSATPQGREMDGWSFASWSEGEVTYTLATPAPPEKLQPYLPATVFRGDAAAEKIRLAGLP